VKPVLPIFILVIFFSSSACVSTSTTAVRNPEFAAAKKFTKVVVLGDFSNLATRKRIEDGLVVRLGDAHITAIPSTSIFIEMPDPSVALPRFAEVGADAVLIIQVTGADVTTHQISGGSSSTQASASCFGGTCSGSSTTTYQSPTYVQKPHMTARAKLVNVATNGLVWQDEGESHGGGFTNFQTLEGSFSAKVTEDLAASGLFETAAVAGKSN
jgi:hypothetical protein